MKKLMATIALILFSATKVIASGPPPLPPLPSQEELDRLNELGRQNMLKYGTGGYAPAATLKPTPSPVAKVDNRFAIDSTQSATLKFEETNYVASKEAETTVSSASATNASENMPSFVFRFVRSMLTRIFSFFK